MGEGPLSLSLVFTWLKTVESITVKQFRMISDLEGEKVYTNKDSAKTESCHDEAQ